MKITALIHDCALEGESGFAATCAEFPEANGQGETVEECLANLRAAVEDVLAYRREEAARCLSRGDRLVYRQVAVPQTRCPAAGRIMSPRNGSVLRFPCVLLMALALASEGRAIVVNEAYTLGGSAALASGFQTHPEFASVGWVEIQEGPSAYRGTGVLIGSDWVLTAAHNWLADQVTALSFHIGGVTYQATTGAWYQHPLWAESPEVEITQGWDVGLFRLSAAVTGIAPAQLYGGTSELGADVYLLGAGMAGTGATGPRPNSGPTMYAARNEIDRVVMLGSGTAAGGLLAMDFDDGSTTRNSLAGAGVYDSFGNVVSGSFGGTILANNSSQAVLNMEGTSAAGDSGGPAFADFGNGPELVGIVSWGVNPTSPLNRYGSGYGDVTYLTRISAVDGWIAGVTIPEPGQIALLGVSLLAVSMQNRAGVCLIFLRKGFVVHSLRIFVPICASLTPRLAQKSAAQPLRGVLHGDGLVFLFRRRYLGRI